MVVPVRQKLSLKVVLPVKIPYNVVMKPFLVTTDSIVKLGMTLQGYKNMNSTAHSTGREREFSRQHNLISTTDAQSRILYANEHFCSITGYPAEELEGENTT